MLLQTLAPRIVFVSGLGDHTAFRFKFLGNRADVIGLESTAAANVANSHVISISGVFMDIPTCRDAGFQAERELRKIDESLETGVWSVVDNRLHHQVVFKSIP